MFLIFEASIALYVEIDKRQAEVDEERSKLGEAKADAAEAAYWNAIREDKLSAISYFELTALELRIKRHIWALYGAAEASLLAKRAKEEEQAE